MLSLQDSTGNTRRLAFARRAGTTLLEMLVALGVSGMVLSAIAQICFFSGQSLTALFNYTDLDAYSRNALDHMSKELRQARSLLYSSDTAVVLEDADGQPLAYYWNSHTRDLIRLKDYRTRPVLRECDYIKFSIFQRNPKGGTYDQYPVATPGTTKLIQVRWICSRKILGTKMNTESVQSAKFVIRNQ